MRKPSKYWTKEHCSEVALLCETKTEFKKKFVSAYNNAYEYGWLDELCSHMKPIGNIVKRLIYSYEFPDNYVYVGLTCNIQRRNRQHHNEISPVSDHIKKFNLTPIKKILSNGYVDVIKAQNLENFWVTKYKDDGWNILNTRKTGGLGGNTIYWNKTNCQKMALKCNTRKEFSLRFTSAYISSRKNNWLEEICSHMIIIRKHRGFWNYVTCKEASLKYNNKFDFSHKCSSAYFVSSKNNWLNEFYPNKIKLDTI